jgi:Protein of unknown function (DUF429)
MADVSPDSAPLLWGVDFSSAPGRRKPIVRARGERRGAVVRLLGLDEMPTLAAFEAALAKTDGTGPWLGAFDFPFGLPRAFVEAHALGEDAAAVSQAVHARCATRKDFQALVDAWGNARPPGQRLIHRATDKAMPGLSSSSPLQTRYVPVGFMWFEGLSRLVAAGVHLPGLHAGDAARVALEGYPGLLAHELIGRTSYKNSEAPDRLLARKSIVEALEQGRTRLGLRLKLTPAQAGALVADASGDRLDAVLCLLQAAWAAGQPGFGLPPHVDPVEGWITTAGMPPG